MLQYCKLFRGLYSKNLRTAFDMDFQQKLQFVNQNFSNLISDFRQSTQLRFVKAVSKQTTPNFGRVSTAECLASKALCVSQGCGKKSYILTDINMLAKAQVWMQLCRQERAFIGLADVVWGGDATTPADKLSSWPAPSAQAAPPARSRRQACTANQPFAATATGKKGPLEQQRDLYNLVFTSSRR